MKVFNIKGSNISMFNKVVLYTSFALLILFSFLGLRLGEILFVLLFVISALSAYSAYKRSVNRIEWDDELLSLFRPGSKEPLVSFQKDHFLYRRTIYGLYTLSKNAGSDQFNLKKGNWDKELIQIIERTGNDASDRKDDSEDFQQKMDDTSGILNLIESFFSR